MTWKQFKMKYHGLQEAIGKVLACLKNKAADQSEDHIRALISAMTTHLEDREIVSIIYIYLPRPR